MTKKLVFLFVLAVLLISTASIASADIWDEKNAILNEYAALLNGKWQLYSYDSSLTKKWDGMDKEITISKENLSIGGDNKVYYQWDYFDHKGNGGEILLSSSKFTIYLVFESNGITTVARYKRIE